MIIHDYSPFKLEHSKDIAFTLNYHKNERHFLSKYMAKYMENKDREKLWNVCLEK